MKRNIKKISLSIIACIITLLVLTTSVYAVDASAYLSTLGETKQISKQYEEWSKLSDERKQEVLAEARMFVINNQQSAELFWNSRDLREKQLEVKSVEEQKTANPSQPVEDTINMERLKFMSEQIKSRMRKF